MGCDIMNVVPNCMKSHSRKPCFSLYFTFHIYNKALACLQVPRFFIVVGSVFQGYEDVSVGNLIPKSWGKVMF